MRTDDMARNLPDGVSFRGDSECIALLALAIVARSVHA
jgi:hypothetical protein